MSHQSPPPAEIAGATYDPLDLHIQRLSTPNRSHWSRLSSHAALLLMTGLALGPEGLAVLTPEVVEALRPAVAVALAVLGVTTALRPTAHGGFWQGGTRLSSALILGGGLAAALYERGIADAGAIAGQAVCIAALLAGAGWMLSSRAIGDEERRVFSIAIFLLLGGVADALSVSALLLGWIAATAWWLARASRIAHMGLDAAYVQHPITALLLIIAGAHVRISWEVALLAVATVAAVMAFAQSRRRRRRDISGIPFGGIAITPSVFAVALAMDAARLDPRLTGLLSIVVLAAAALDVVFGRAAEDAA